MNGDPFMPGPFKRIASSLAAYDKEQEILPTVTQQPLIAHSNMMAGQEKPL